MIEAWHDHAMHLIKLQLKQPDIGIPMLKASYSPHSYLEETRGSGHSNVVPIKISRKSFIPKRPISECAISNSRCCETNKQTKKKTKKTKKRNKKNKENPRLL
jgi:hypothetical protein